MRQRGWSRRGGSYPERKAGAQACSTCSAKKKDGHLPCSWPCSWRSLSLSWLFSRCRLVQSCIADKGTNSVGSRQAVQQAAAQGLAQLWLGSGSVPKYRLIVMAQAAPTCSRREAVPCESRSAASATSSWLSVALSRRASASRLLAAALREDGGAATVVGERGGRGQPPAPPGDIWASPCGSPWVKSTAKPPQPCPCPPQALHLGLCCPPPVLRRFQPTLQLQHLARKHRAGQTALGPCCRHSRLGKGGNPEPNCPTMWLALSHLLLHARRCLSSLATLDLGRRLALVHLPQQVLGTGSPTLCSDRVGQQEQPRRPTLCTQRMHAAARMQRPWRASCSVRPRPHGLQGTAATLSSQAVGHAPDLHRRCRALRWQPAPWLHAAG